MCSSVYISALAKITRALHIPVKCWTRLETDLAKTFIVKGKFHTSELGFTCYL